jgi:CubicO group peptidase (beta-lactamase class C family)
MTDSRQGQAACVRMIAQHIRIWFRIMSLLSGTLLILASGCTTSKVQTKNSLTGSVDELFAKWNKPDSPGCAVAVIREGKVIYERGYGCANLEYGTPITPSSVFYIASVSKQFTAMSVLLLAQQGKLSLDDDIRKYLSEVPDFGRVITIRHLFHHTSGLRDYEELLAMAGWRMDDVITRQHMLNIVSRQKELNFSPGNEYQYCNTGYCLLAEIVARVSEQSFSAFTDANIFKPLGMTNTHFHDDHERIVRNRAYSYRPDGRKSFKNAFNNASVVGGGGMYSTVEDLAKWLNNFDDGRVGGPEVLKQMHEQGVLNNGQTNRYAFGLAIDEHKGMKMVEHNGAFAGYRSDLIRFPDQKLAVVLLGNTSAINASQLTRQIADVVLLGTTPKKSTDSPKQKSLPRPIASMDAANFDAFRGEYELKPGVLVSVSRDGNRLYAKATGLPKVELLPETESAFFIKEDGSRVSFERDERGQVNRLTLHEKSGTHVAQRIIQLRPEELTGFVGDYYSDELGTAYTILLRNGKLLAQHRRHGDIRLVQTSVPDEFVGQVWFPFHVAFTRDTQNRVAGFKLTGERSRNLRFEKRLEAVPPKS